MPNLSAAPTLNPARNFAAVAPKLMWFLFVFARPLADPPSHSGKATERCADFLPNFAAVLSGLENAEKLCEGSISEKHKKRIQKQIMYLHEHLNVEVVMMDVHSKGRDTWCSLSGGSVIHLGPGGFLFMKEHSLDCINHPPCSVSIKFLFDIFLAYYFAGVLNLIEYQDLSAKLEAGSRKFAIDKFLGLLQLKSYTDFFRFCDTVLFQCGAIWILHKLCE